MGAEETADLLRQFGAFSPDTLEGKAIAKAAEKYEIVADLYRECHFEEPEPVLTPVPPIRYVEAEADTGSRYVVVVTPLPPGHREGGPVLVTLVSPWQTAWTMQPIGRLHVNYVAEHFAKPHGAHGGWQWNAADLFAVWLTIGHALGRVLK